MRSAGFIEAMRAARNLAAINVRAGEDVLIVSSTDQHDEIHGRTVIDGGRLLV